MTISGRFSGSNRSSMPSGSFGALNRNSTKSRVGLRLSSNSASRRYSSAESTTTASTPRFVTCCGTPFWAASTTAENLFLASCSVHWSPIATPPLDLAGQ